MRNFILAAVIGVIVVGGAFALIWGALAITGADVDKCCGYAAQAILWFLLALPVVGIGGCCLTWLQENTEAFRPPCGEEE